MLNMIERLKISLEAGEFIHSVANRLRDGTINIQGVSPKRADIIMEISEVLRSDTVLDSNAPILLSEGFRISKYPRSAWISLASYLLDGTDETSLDSYFKMVGEQAECQHSLGCQEAGLERTKSPHANVEQNELLDVFDNDESSHSGAVGECVLLSLLILLLIFLFWGEPDVWDSLRAYCMNL